MDGHEEYGAPLAPPRRRGPAVALVLLALLVALLGGVALVLAGLLRGRGGPEHDLPGWTIYDVFMVPDDVSYEVRLSGSLPRLEVVVRDAASFEPIPGAAVSVFGASEGGPTVTGKSGADGRATLDASSLGPNVTVCVTPPGRLERRWKLLAD